MDSIPPEEEPSQNDGSNDDGDNEATHRIEAKAYVFLFLWIFSDFLVIFGHTGFAAWVFYFVLVFALGLAAHHAIKGWKPWKKVIYWSFALFCIALPFILYFFSRPGVIGPEPVKPHPNLIFAVRRSTSPVKDQTWLTNDFLIVTNFSPKIHRKQPAGVLLIPMELGESNMTLRFSVQNDSPVVAELVEVAIGVSPRWRWEPSPHWMIGQYEMQEIVLNAVGSLITNDLQQRASFVSSPMLSGNGTELPDIQFSLPTPDLWPRITMLARAKDSPSFCITFVACSSTGTNFEKPTVLFKNIESNGTEWIKLR